MSAASHGTTYEGMFWMLIISRGIAGVGAGGEYPVSRGRTEYSDSTDQSVCRSVESVQQRQPTRTSTFERIEDSSSVSSITSQIQFGSESSTPGMIGDFAIDFG
jgi:hypothetical protein